MIIGVIIFLALFAGGIYLLSAKNGNDQSGKYDTFAQCLKDKGAVFYGAFWCSHCQNTKAEFGSSAKLLNYIECSTADGQGQLDVCNQKNITGYPTWEFADGSRLEGEVPLTQLAEKTGCELPK